MILTRTLTKKILEQIIKESFSKFGSTHSSLLLDSLKFLGFYYATKAGISINIEDLKTPEAKKDILEENSEYIKLISQNWYRGKISDTERFQSIIDQWNSITELLKNKIIDFYQKFDPANNLYIMSFSGARGNMSQVRQLIGMRGLMSDQEGNIIDLPIQNNFREGLSSLDYLISSYGARKGVVDTALKTADSGYLTRRLIYVAQDLVIREVDCKTNQGILVNLKKNASGENLIGRYLLSSIPNYEKFQKLINKPIDEKSLLFLKGEKNAQLKIRSCLTCESAFSICQKCYGWDLSKRATISLGEAVGIIAAQSIGEPGTQLTMRTFHTGGIFTSELLQQNLAPFSGKLHFPENTQLINCRTNHGLVIAKTQQEVRIKITDWKGKEEILIVPFGSFLYKTESGFVRKGELISEGSSTSLGLSLKRLKPVYSPVEGQIIFKKLETTELGFKKMNICKRNGVLWIHSGKLFNFPFESNILLRGKKISPKNSLGTIKILCPSEGLFQIEKEKIKILQKDKKFEINLANLRFAKTNKNNIKIKISILIKNNQFVDPFTVIGYCYISSKENYKIYKIKKFVEKESLNIFLISESDIWNLTIDEIRKQYKKRKINQILNYNERITGNLICKNSGVLIKKDGLYLTFQKVYPIFLTRGSFINYSTREFIYKGDNLASLVSYRQQTEDIVQGLPKIDDLVEARPPKKSAFLNYYPNVVLKLKPKKNKNLEIVKAESTSIKNTKVRVFSFKNSPMPKSKKGKKDREDCLLIPAYSIVYCKELKRNKKKNLISKKLGSRKDFPLQSSYKNMSFVDLAQALTDGLVNSHELLKCLNLYHRKRSGSIKGSIKSLNKFQLILVNSIQAIYTSQGVEISTKHLEIIARQMTSKARIISSTDRFPFFENESVRLSLMLEVGKILKKCQFKVRPSFEPILLSSTSCSLNKSGFLVAAGFQETKRVLTRAALEGHKDWLKGVKECIITGRLIPAGSAFLNYKNYLDTLYLYKKYEYNEKALENP